jgi:hypothetical protein
LFTHTKVFNCEIHKRHINLSYGCTSKFLDVTETVFIAATASYNDIYQPYVFIRNTLCY